MTPAPSGSPTIERLGPGDVEARLASLTALLIDAVDSGASIGFLPPLTPAEAGAYWGSVATALAEGTRVLVVASAAGEPALGAAQLELAGRRNASHRAEVTKVMVHQAARRRGIGRALMVALEAAAREMGRTTLVLDTRQGDPSEALYAGLGWTHAGTIPRYARSATGVLDATCLYYKLLDA